MYYPGISAPTEMPFEFIYVGGAAVAPMIRGASLRIVYRTTY